MFYLKIADVGIRVISEQIWGDDSFLEVAMFIKMLYAKKNRIFENEINLSKKL